MLGNANRDGLSEAFWGFVGAGLAALPSAADALWKAYVEQPALPLTILHQFEIAIVTIAVAVAVALRIVSISRGQRARDLISAIRTRERLTR
jgi:hypothetical protein